MVQLKFNFNSTKVISAIPDGDHIRLMIIHMGLVVLACHPVLFE